MDHEQTVPAAEPAQKRKRTPRKPRAPKSEASAKKPLPAKKRGRPSNPQGIGVWCRREIEKHGEKKTNGQIALEARKHFKSQTTSDCIAWYRSKMRREAMEGAKKRKSA